MLRLFVVSILTGIASGALLGGVVAACVVVLADFTRVPSDLLTLTVYAIAPVGLLGAAAAGVIAIGAVIVTRLRGGPLPAAAFTRRLAIIAFGSALLAIAAVAYIVARRPTLVVSASTLLPILMVAVLLLVTAYVAGRRAPAGATRLAVRPATAIGITLASFALPLVLGFLRPTIVGESPARPSTAPIERDGGASKVRVLLLGWDGATWDVIDPLLRQGAMPTLARLLERGSRGVILAEPQVIQPFANSASAGARTPALWETVATGQRPLHHGIWDFECKLFGGVEQAVPFRIAGDHGGHSVPTTGDMARAERLWHILDRAGISTAVVGWPNTWPARRGLQNGIISSSMANEDVPYNVQPEGAVDVRSICGDTEAEARRTERALFALDGADTSSHPWEVVKNELEADLLRTFFWDYNNDLCNARIALDLNARHRPDFLAVYLRLVDIVQHKFWRYYQPEVFGDVPPELVERYGRAIEFAYRFFDEQLAKLLDSMGDDAIVIVLSDHGGGPWAFGGLQWLIQAAFRQFHPEYSGNHRLNGILAAGGPGISPGATFQHPGHVDITPTILHLFGLPLADDMPGRVLREAIDGERTAPRPSRSIPTYQTELSSGGLRPTASSADGEVEGRLRALGYIR
jgi:predicted AlkP superfamily phosphohydrolase/phosphomutase